MKKKALLLGIMIALLLTGCGEKESTSKGESGSTETIVTEGKKEGVDNKGGSEEEAGPVDYSELQGDYVLYDNEDFTVRIVGGVHTPFRVDGDYTIEMMVECSLKDGFDKNVRMELYSIFVNDVQLNAELAGTLFFDMDPAKERVKSYLLRVKKDDVKLFNAVVADPKIKKVQLQMGLSSDNANKRYEGISNEVKTDDCPDKFALVDSLKLVHSDNRRDVFISEAVDLQKDCITYLFVSDIKGTGNDIYDEDVGTKYKINGKAISLQNARKSMTNRSKLGTYGVFAIAIMESEYDYFKNADSVEIECTDLYKRCGFGYDSYSNPEDFEMYEYTIDMTDAILNGIKNKQ